MSATSATLLALAVLAIAEAPAAATPSVPPANCPAALVKRVEAGEVMRGPVVVIEPDGYPLGFVLDEGAELHGGRHGLVLVMKMCDDGTVLEISSTVGGVP